MPILLVLTMGMTLVCIIMVYRLHRAFEVACILPASDTKTRVDCLVKASDDAIEAHQLQQEGR